MRKMARVWNLDTQPYTEEYRGQTITIEPEKFIVMDPNEAALFLKAFTPVIKDGRGQYINPKKLRMELYTDKTASSPKRESKFQCMVDGEIFPTQRAYDEHVLKKHMNEIVDKESKEAFEVSQGDL